MTAGWVAGSVRAKALARRQIGAAEARRVAASGSLADAVAMLESTPYRAATGGVPDSAGNSPGELAALQHEIGAALLWNLRVLAGWLPRGGAELMRELAGWFEIANVSELLRELDGSERASYFDLGALATAWPRSRHARSLPELRRTLAESAWRDPGGDAPADIEIGLRARWAERVAAHGEPARTWAASALALMMASDCIAASRAPSSVLRSVATSLLGPAAVAAGTIDDLAAALPRRLSWVLARGTPADDLWMNEAIWWRRVESDAHGLLARSGFEPGPAIAATVLLAADARRVWSALEIAARGGGPIEAFDAVA
jgi:hypothetical protein